MREEKPLTFSPNPLVSLVSLSQITLFPIPSPAGIPYHTMLVSYLLYATLAAMHVLTVAIHHFFCVLLYICLHYIFKICG